MSTLSASAPSPRKPFAQRGEGWGEGQPLALYPLLLLTLTLSPCKTGRGDEALTLARNLLRGGDRLLPFRNWTTPVTAPSNSFAAPRLADILAPDRNSFGMLRLLAALAVVVSHSVHLVGAPESAEPLASATGFSLGEHAVHVFFTISGVLIAASLMRSATTLDYLRARALRLLPGLAVCVALTALVAGPMLSDLSFSQYFRDASVWRYIVLSFGLVTANAPLPGVFTHNPVPDIVNLPLWTLKYETMCYLGLILLGAAGVMRSAKLATVALAPLLLAWVTVAAFPEQLHVGSTLLSFLRLSFSFGLGTLAYAWRDKLPLHWFGVAGALFVMALALGTRFQMPADQLFVAYTTLWAASLPAGWLASATRKNDLSYGVYIYDWVIAQSLMHWFPQLSQPVLLGATLALLLPVAALSWFLIEKPALSWKARPAKTAEASDRLRLALRQEAPAQQAALEPAEPVILVFPADGPARDRFARIANGCAVVATSEHKSTPHPVPQPTGEGTQEPIALQPVMHLPAVDHELSLA